MVHYGPLATSTWQGTLHDFFATIPNEIRELAGAAAQWAGGEFTGAFWGLADGPLHGSWCDATNLVFASTDIYFGDESLDEWARTTPKSTRKARRC